MPRSGQTANPYLPPRQRIGAKRDQYGNVGPGAQPAQPPVGLSPAHDWSSFDAFKAMNQKLQRPTGTVTSAPPAGAPLSSPVSPTAAPSVSPAASPVSAFTPVGASLSPIASLALGAAEALGASAPSRTTPAPAGPARPVVNPGQVAADDGTTIRAGGKGTTIEYDPSKNKGLNRTVERVPGTDEARTSMPVDPRYGGGTAFATGVRGIPRQDNERFVAPSGPVPETRDPLMLAALKARTPVASAPVAPASVAPPVSPAPVAAPAAAPIRPSVTNAPRPTMPPNPFMVPFNPMPAVNYLGERARSAWVTPNAFEGWAERREGAPTTPSAPAPAPSALAAHSAFQAARPAIDAFQSGITANVPQTGQVGLPAPGMADPEEERRRREATLAGR